MADHPKTAPACDYQTQAGPCSYRSGHIGEHKAGPSCPGRHNPSDPRWNVEAGTCTLCLLERQGRFEEGAHLLRLRVEAMEQDAAGLRSEIAELRLRVAPLDSLIVRLRRHAQAGATAWRAGEEAGAAARDRVVAGLRRGARSIYRAIGSAGWVWPIDTTD